VTDDGHTEAGEHTREAIQFGVVALCSLIALRLLHAGIGLLLAAEENDTLAQALEPFKQGYLVSPRTLVIDAAPMYERLSIAILLAFGIAVLFALAAWLLARAMGAPPKRWTLRAARIVLLLSVVLLLFSAIAVPHRSVHFTEEHVVYTERPMGTPFGARTMRLSWADLDLRDGTVMRPANRTAPQNHVRVRGTDGRDLFRITLDPRVGKDSSDALDVLTTELRKAQERYLGQHP